LLEDGTIVVFGSTGLVGSALIRSLSKKGYSHIIGTYHRRIPTDTPANVRYIPLDLIKQQDVWNFFHEFKPQYVFLAAAKVGGILANDTYKADFIYENITIAANVIHAAYKYGVKKLLNLGSSCIYPKEAPQPIREVYLLSGPLEPTNEPYAIAKIAAIKLCRYFNEQYGTNFFSVMPANLYGPNDNFDLFTSHVLPALLRKFHLAKALAMDDLETIKKDLNLNPIEGITGNSSYEEILNILAKCGIARERTTPVSLRGGLSPVTVTLWGSGEPLREFLYVDDLAEACIYLMENFTAPDLRKFSPDYFVNVGTGSDLKIADLANLIREIVGFEGKLTYDPTKPDGTPRKLLDVSPLNTLGWVSKTPLKEGIAQTYRTYLEAINSL